MKRRVRTLQPGYLVGTKGHSVLKKKTYAVARKPSLDVEEIVVQRMPISRKTVVEYYPESVYNRASAYSNAVVDDCYDLHHHSKGRDHHLLKKMNNALHPEEFDPKTSFSSPSSRSSMSRRHPRHHQHTSYRSSSNTEPNHSSSETSCTDLVPFLESARNQLSRSQPFCARSNLGTGNKRFTSLLHEKPNEHYDSPLTAYIKGKWTTPVPSPTVDRSLSSNLHHPLFEDTSSRTLSLPKYSYLDSTDFSSDEEYDTESKYGGHTIVERKRPYKPGQLLKALRRKRRERDENSAPEDNGEGAYAIVYKDDLEADDENTEAYTDDEHDYKIVSRRKHRYLNRESSPEYDGDLPVAPYHSKLHKYQKYDDDIGVNSLVAMATLRARDALRQIAGVNSKAGYLSIEGDIRPHGGELSTFKLESPFQFRGPLMINQRPQLSASNDAYENLVMTLRRQRESERERLNSNFIMKKPALQIAPYSQSQSSLRPLGYMSDESLKSYTKALMPSNSPFDRTIVTPLTPKKSVHFDDEFEPRSSSSFLRELYPTEPAERRGDREAAEEEQQQYEMAVAPRRRRYPIYEYTEEIPVKIKVDDDSDYEDISPGRLSVVEKIRIKLSTQPLRSPKAAVATRRATSNSAQTVRFPAYNEALLVGDDKLAEPGHPRRTRRRYYPDRPVHRDLQESLASMGIPDTSGLKASRPPGPSAVPSHSWKAIREVEGYTKPHMTWEYRLDADAGPEHQIPKGSVPYVHVRDQVRGVQDKMDRHRQLLDRYYDRPAMDVLDTHTSGLGHSGGRTQTDDSAAGEMLGKVSPLRKKIRKVICKSRRDPSYYDD